MKPELQALRDQLEASLQETARLELAIRDFMQSCKHERDPADHSYCLHCDGYVPADGSQRIQI